MTRGQKKKSEKQDRQIKTFQHILNTTYILTMEIVHNDRVMSLPSKDSNKPNTDNPPQKYNDE